MRLQPRTLVLASIVVVMGIALAYRYVPVKVDAPKTPTPKQPRLATKEKNDAVSTPRAEVNIPGSTVAEAPAATGSSVAVAAMPPSDAPPALQIPDLTSQLPPSKVPSEPDPRQIGGFRGEIFMRLDENGDLRLDRSEIPEFCREQMIACDANHDGKIDFQEFTSSIPKLPTPPAVRATVAASALVNPPEPGQEIPTYEPQVQKRSGDVPMWFLQLDRSKDGHIAIYEWPPGRLMEFRALDLNDDGFITLEEAKKAEAIKNAAKGESSPSPARHVPDRASAP